MDSGEELLSKLPLVISLSLSIDPLHFSALHFAHSLVSRSHLRYVGSLISVAFVLV